MASRHLGCLGNSVRKRKRNKSSRGSARASGNEEAYVEIQSFMKALDSYPERFARRPGMSFEQHHRGFGRVKRRGVSIRAKQNDRDVPRS